MYTEDTKEKEKEKEKENITSPLTPQGETGKAQNYP